MNVGRIGPAPATPTPQRARDLPDPGFASSLDRLLDPGAATPAAAGERVATEGIRFSRHAAARLQSRGVEVGQDELAALSEAVDRLGERGARESLVVLGDNAYVVGVGARTVITAMPRAEALGTVFTNIDSTFIASL